MDRRQFLTAGSAVAFQVGSRALFPNLGWAAQSATKADFTLRIAPVSVELAPGKIVKVVGYNGSVPGPLLRMREGVSITVDVFNDTDTEELVHWHGLMVTAEVDGAAEGRNAPGTGPWSSPVHVHPQASRYKVVPHSQCGWIRPHPRNVQRTVRLPLHRAKE